jgi:ABC-type transporter Mla subunit MlaD
MTDPTTPNHDQPVEGSRSESYTRPDAGNGASSGASDTGSNAAAKASDVLETLRDAVEDFAEKAAPVVRQFSAKAAEVVATAADKAVPLAQKAGEATADASGKLAVKSRTWAAEVRESLSDNGTTDKKEPPTTF